MDTSLLCLNIFIVKIIEVSLNTIVTLLTVKNKKIIATILGFIDVIIWFLVVREAIAYSNSSMYVAFAFALGHAIGTYIGTFLSNKLINTKILMQVITDKKNNINSIRTNGYAVSEVECIGKDNSKKIMLFIEVDSKKLNELENIIRKIDNKAFITINETKYVVNGYFK